AELDAADEHERIGGGGHQAARVSNATGKSASAAATERMPSLTLTIAPVNTLVNRPSRPAPVATRGSSQDDRPTRWVSTAPRRARSRGTTTMATSAGATRANAHTWSSRPPDTSSGT